MEGAGRAGEQERKSEVRKLDRRNNSKYAAREAPNE